jgi:hypothetical protein
LTGCSAIRSSTWRGRASGSRPFNKVVAISEAMAAVRFPRGGTGCGETARQGL